MRLTRRREIDSHRIVNFPEFEQRIVEVNIHSHLKFDLFGLIIVNAFETEFHHFGTIHRKIVADFRMKEERGNHCVLLCRLIEKYGLYSLINIDSVFTAKII